MIFVLLLLMGQSMSGSHDILPQNNFLTQSFEFEMCLAEPLKRAITFERITDEEVGVSEAYFFSNRDFITCTSDLNCQFINNSCSDVCSSYDSLTCSNNINCIFITSL